ncbi:MAG: hypothetical protein FWG34_08220 [Oscillospiraceae bacterium]|nr:hypothetical protein [Oscillospiraceae bacterium]
MTDKLKRQLNFLIAFALALAALAPGILAIGCSDASPKTEPKETSEFGYVAEAYYGILQAAISEYGIFGEESGEWMEYMGENIPIGGIEYAELIDFGGDGLQELLYVYFCRRWLGAPYRACYVYGYSGDAKLYCDVYSSIGVGSAGIREFDIVADGNGQKYLAFDWGNGIDGKYEYYTVASGKWVLALSGSRGYECGDYLWCDIRGMHTCECPYFYYVNGQIATKEEYENAPATELGLNAANSLIYNLGKVETLDVFPKITNSVLAVFAELKSK